MTESDLITLITNNNEVISNQFQFWISASFAVVVVSFTAGTKLKLVARLFIIFLYLTAAVMFYLRYLDALDESAYYVSLLSQMDSEFAPNRLGLVSTLRKIIMFAGTIGGVVLTLIPSLYASIDNPGSTAN